VRPAFRRNIEGFCSATRSNTMNVTSGTERRGFGSPLQGSVFPGGRSPWALPRAVLARPFGPLRCPNSSPPPPPGGGGGIKGGGGPTLTPGLSCPGLHHSAPDGAEAHGRRQPDGAILMNGTTSQLVGVPKEITNVRDRAKVAYPPPPLPPDYLRTLLITKARTRNRDLYPTMCMIISDLVQNFQKLLFCFHRDRLWINPKARKSVRRTHDVYNSKGLNTKIPEAPPLYSIRYTEKNSENGASLCPEPTMSMNTKSVRVSGAKASRSYVVEIKARSALAPQGRRSLTHDVLEGRRFNLRRCPWICRRRQEIASLYVASSLAGLFISIVIPGWRRPLGLRRVCPHLCEGQDKAARRPKGLRQPRRTMMMTGGTC